MRTRKFSLLFFLFSILAGVIGFVMGEYLLYKLGETLPNTILMGIYFSQLALWIGFFCLLAEVISPTINGRSWKLQYSGTSWKVLVPATALLLFVGSLVFQFIYGLNFSKVEPPDDIVLVMDISESMLDTDPQGESIDAAKQFITMMDHKHRAAVITFNHDAYVTLPMFGLSNEEEKEAALLEMEGLEPSGGTDIGKALQTSMDHLTTQREENRKPMVILFSDGYSEFDLKAAVKEYKKQKVVVNTIGMSAIDFMGASTLKKIASETGGMFHDVTDIAQLGSVIEDIYLDENDRHLVGERTGYYHQSLYLSILRVLCITLIGALIGLSLGIIFDNRYLAKSYLVGGIVSGLLAGFVLENGLQHTIFSFGTRAIADILLAVVMGLGTLIIPVKEKSTVQQISREGFNKSVAPTFDRKPSTKKGFS